MKKNNEGEGLLEKQSYSMSAQRARPVKNFGPELRCPKCNNLIGKGDVLAFETRCDKCKHWIVFNRLDR